MHHCHLSTVDSNIVYTFVWTSVQAAGIILLLAGIRQPRKEAQFEVYIPCFAGRLPLRYRHWASAIILRPCRMPGSWFLCVAACGTGLLCVWQGYPGQVTATVTYTLAQGWRGSAEVQIRFEAETTAPTPINMAQHCYFNLGGTSSPSSVLDHRIRINACATLHAGAGALQCPDKDGRSWLPV